VSPPPEQNWIAVFTRLVVQTVWWPSERAVSAVERKPAQLVAQPLVVEHKSSDPVGELSALPLHSKRPAASRSSSTPAARAALIA
jgi:hypothetical protein